jgi:tripartite-type tricarboxylate transporter receptor subunit TctC
MRGLRSGLCRMLRALLLAVFIVPAAVAAQEFPSRPVRFIVGFVPGGIADLMARSLGQKLSEAWGQQVITDNRPSSGGVLSMQITAKAAPDGYTLLLGSSTQFSITPALRPNLTYDPVRDYTAITRIAMTPVILTVQSSFPAKSMPELIQVAKAKPGQMNYGSPGYGGAPHIAAELLKRTAGLDIVHVPFKGGGESVVALLGGHLQLLFGAVSTSLPHVKGGRLRALGVTSARRLTATPDVPTFAESGLPGFEVEQWYGIFAPAAMPPAITRKLNQALVRILETEQLRKEFSGQGIEVVSSTPEALAAYVKSERARWGKVLKDLGIQDQP